MAVVAAADRSRGRRRASGSELCIELGLVNNMPDAALERTERQFFNLLGAAAPDLLVRVSFFSLAGIPRGEPGRDHLQRNGYRSAHELALSNPDALIVTGTEPGLPDLRLEPYWSELTRLFDWVDEDGPSAIFSCLAAHAAVLHYDGIARQRLPAKRFGLFDHFVAGHDYFTAELAQSFRVAHSRWNELGESALAACGYRILTWAPGAGVDLFVKRRRNDLLFCQGHPEYDPGTLGREVHRDVRRWLARESDDRPALPANYFTPAETLALGQFLDRAHADRCESLMAHYPSIRRRPESRWQPPAAPVFRAWLRQIVEAKRCRPARPCAAPGATMHQTPEFPPPPQAGKGNREAVEGAFGPERFGTSKPPSERSRTREFEPGRLKRTHGLLAPSTAHSRGGGHPPSLVSEVIPYWAARAPGATALVEGGRRWSYRELDRAVRLAAHWLRNAGTRRGDRVMLVCENCRAAVALYFACTDIGAWPVLANARMSERELEEIRKHSGARRMIFTSEASLRARQHGESHGAATLDPAGIGQIMVGALDESAEPEPPAARREDDIALLIYTSGTTGRPKGVMLSHRNLMFVAGASARARLLSPDDRVPAILPISHILGLTGVLLGSLVSGAAVHLVSRFDPALLSSFERDRLSVVIGTPSMYAMLAEYAARKGTGPIAAPTLRLISTAGAPLDAPTKAAAEELFGRPLHNGYGITECSPTVSLTLPDHPRRDLSVGVPLPGIETRIVDPCGQDAADIGELWVRGPGVMRGYYHAAAETLDVITQDGWFRTGDLARITDGHLFIAGRSKEMLIRFGFNVYPAEIEGVLNAHPAVARSAVVASARNGGEDMLAFIELRPGASPATAELARYAADNLAPCKRPSGFVFVDALPLTLAGRILKSALAVSLALPQPAC